ncbi:MAG: peptide chain release factor N(5)-glutamine methyltransferase, partial [Cyanobacteria bacterium]|nr:peptide chain release factor N(5)-glutamine methyltransferase [Cyanobacteriota bacterium]
EWNTLWENTVGVTWQTTFTQVEMFEISETLKHQIEKLIHRRIQERIPLQYLLGQAYFYGRAFKVTPDVLIPRADTEILVEKAIEWVAKNNFKRICDLGTGSGIIAICLASQYQNIQVVAVDVSPAALDIAQQNAQQNQLNEGAIQFLCGDLLAHNFGEALWADIQANSSLETPPTFPGEKPFDLMVSNPPYIDGGLKATLAPEVIQYEPHLALFSEPDPYRFYRQILNQVPLLLKPGGGLLVEVGEGMASTVQELMRVSGFKDIESHADFNGILRVLGGRWP